MKDFTSRLRQIILVVIVGFASVLYATDAFAQSVSIEEDEIRAVVNDLFDAMRAGDGERVRSLFHPSATMGTAVSDADSVFIRAGDVDRFAAAVGSDRDEVWDERIRGLSIHVDGVLASAWMEYAFFVGGRFSHCGVNAMTFLRASGGWQIMTVLDTRRTVDCEQYEWQ